MKRWSLGWKCCRHCGTTDRKHRGRGLCVNCFEKVKYAEGRHSACKRLKPKPTGCPCCGGSGRVVFDLLGKTYSHACFTCRGVPKR